MDLSDSINIPGFGPLPYIDNNPRNFFRRTTIAYGPSETGKSVIVRYIMKILRPYIPAVIVICPTDGANEGYKGIVPERCIFTRIDTKLLEDTWARQEEASETYNKANNIDVLRELFVKANDMSAMGMVTRIERLTRDNIAQITRDPAMNSAQRKEQTRAIEKSLMSAQRRIYKKTIRNARDQLARRDLTEDEKYAIKFIDFNPALLLIMDDCQAQIAEWIKNPTVAKLFYQIRHVWGTLLMTMQSDTGRPGLPPGIRGNVFTSIFTDPTVATRFFNNKDNGFTTEDRKRATKVIYELFRENANGAENYKRFVYARLDKKAKFRYFIPDDPETFQFGAPSLWRLCENIPQFSKKDGNTKFAGCFTI